MKQIKLHTIFVLLLLAIVGCKYSKQNGEKNSPKINVSTDSIVNEIEQFVEESQNYLENRDFDGDGISDYLSFSYSGGAHCCYKMSIKLSSTKDTIHYPFEMDGGYEYGIDGSQPNQFNIEDYDKDGLPEIFMRISTYNQELYPIDEEWTKEYEIKTNYIIFDFHDGKVILSDYNNKKRNN